MDKYKSVFGIIEEGIILRMDGRRWNYARLHRSLAQAAEDFKIPPDEFLDMALTISDCVDLQDTKSIADSAYTIARMVSGGGRPESRQRPDLGFSGCIGSFG